MNPERFQEILAKHKKVAVVGGPQCGKTTLAATCKDRPVHHNDSGKHIPWDDQPDYWKNVTAGQSSFVIEGVQAARAIRQGLHVDAVVWLDSPKKELSSGQEAMRKGQHTIMKDVQDKFRYLPIYHK